MFFCFIILATVFWFREPLSAALSISTEGDNAQYYSHIPLVPFLSLYFLYLKRAAIFRVSQWGIWPGLCLMVAAGGVYKQASPGIIDQPDSLSPHLLAAVMMLWGGFVFCYGVTAFRIAFFGLGFLMLAIPIPSFLLVGIIEFLQRASADTSEGLFSLLGVPVFRQGFIFNLSSFSVEVAEECSGIRSALALFITSLIAGHLFLRSVWGKVLLVVFIVPLAIVKNAFRIVGLSVLANYVDPRFVTDSALHRNGGIPLFLLALAILFSVVLLSRKVENRFMPVRA